MNFTEYDYERECNDIDETKEKEDKIAKKLFGELRDDLIELKEHKGNICRQGCYRIGYKSGREFAIKEFIKDLIYIDTIKPRTNVFERVKKIKDKYTKLNQTSKGVNNG